MLTERQERILEAVVRDYVGRAEPVASEHLVRVFRLPYSPATVRSDLQDLEEAGYLMQPHTSAGRLPTDRGYRFFINHLLDDNGLTSREAAALAAIRRLTDPAAFMREAGRMLAGLAHSFVLTGFPGEALFYKAGLGAVLQEPEFSDSDTLLAFGALTDRIEDEIRRYFAPQDLGAAPRAFIGSENPIRAARSCGMIITALADPSGRESMVAIIGPKRMDYGHNLALLRRVAELLAD